MDEGRYEVTEVDPEDGRRLFHVLDTALVAPPTGPSSKGRAPARASRYYLVWRMGPHVCVQRSPGGKLRVLVQGERCTCPSGLMGRHCVHRLLGIGRG